MVVLFISFKNLKYKYVYEIDRAYIKWLLDQKNIKDRHPFMFNYFEIKMKEHDED